MKKREARAVPDSEPAPPLRPYPQRAAGRGGPGPHASLARGSGGSARPGPPGAQQPRRTAPRPSAGPASRRHWRPKGLRPERGGGGRPGGRARRAFRSCGPRRDLPRAHAAILPPLLALSKWPPGPAAPASPPGPGSGVRGPPSPRPRSVAGGTAESEGRRPTRRPGVREVRVRPRVRAAQPALCSPESAAAARLLRGRREAAAPPQVEG